MSCASSAARPTSGAAEPERGQPAGRSRLGERAQHAMHHDRLRSCPAQRQLAGGLEGEASAGRAACVASDTRMVPGAAADEQPRRRVHGVARSPRRRRLACPAEAAGHHRARCERRCGASRAGRAAAAHCSAERRGALQHVQRRVARARCGSSSWATGAPNTAMHGVAHELLDEAVIARDRLGQRVEQRGLERAHYLGIEPLGRAR